MKILRRAKKVRLDKRDWELIRTNPSQIEILQKLDLLPKDEPKRRGRPRKQPPEPSV